MDTTFGYFNTAGVRIRLKPERMMTDWFKAFSGHETTSVGVSVKVMIWDSPPQRSSCNGWA